MPRVTLDGNGREQVLVVHGWCLDASGWQWARPHTDTARFAYAYLDLPGYGLARDRAPLTTLDAMAREVLAAADELGWSRFSVVGHGMGGTTALRAATLAPRRISRLALLSPVSADGTELAEETRRSYEHAWPEASWVFTHLSPGLSAERVALLSAIAAGAVTGEAWRRSLHAWVQTRFVDALRDLRVPVRILLGRDDTFVTEPYLRRTLEALGSADVHVIEGMGHFGLVERPSEVVLRWERWIRQAPATQLSSGPPRLA